MSTIYQYVLVTSDIKTKVKSPCPQEAYIVPKETNCLGIYKLYTNKSKLIFVVAVGKIQKNFM